jgi:formylglycine-generating enzyme required for sulfatase activity
LEEADWRVKYIFGTSFDESHKEIAEEDLHHAHYGADVRHDVPDRGHGTAAADPELLKKKRHGEFSETPRPYGHVDTHPLDGGIAPAKVVEVEPFFLDATPVTNADFAKFVSSTSYETEAEKYRWSFVLASFVSPKLLEAGDIEVDPEAPNWVAVAGAYWRQPEGPRSSYKYREQHPVVHVSHRDAAEYCSWVGKRLPGEFEYEAAARSAPHYSGPKNRTLFLWGEDQSVETASRFANLWGAGKFPDENLAEDGWRGTSPVKNFGPNHLGFYDMTGNVWEWMRGGKSRARIVRGASYVDSLDGSFNHAATLGARSTLHGTTTTGNVGFRCAKSPKKRLEYHWTWHDEEEHGRLAVEDEFGKRDMVPQRDWEDLFRPELEEDEFGRKRKRVVKRVERLSDEL